MDVNLDIAETLGAVLWPSIVLLLLYVYRTKLPTLFESIMSRIQKVEFAGISLELAKAKEFTLDWSGATGGLDLRSKATALDINDSYTETFRNQLLGEGHWEYAEIDLGEGQSWLTSRLFIMAIVFARMKGIKCLVFVKTSGNVRKRFVCWAEPEKVRWALAKRFPWLEAAYSAAYFSLVNYPEQQMSPPINVPILNSAGIIVSNDGRIGAEGNMADPWPSIGLIQQFVARVQVPQGQVVPNDDLNWVAIQSTAQPTMEHARWIGSLELEDWLGMDCHKTQLKSRELAKPNLKEQLKKILSEPNRYVAVIGENQQFEYLIDRAVILEQVAKIVP